MKLSEVFLPPTAAARSGAIRRLAPLLLALLTVLGALAVIAGTGRLARFDVARSPGDGSERAALVRFHDVEYSAGRPYSWSLPEAALFFYGFDGRPLLLRLRLAAPRPADAAAAVTSLSMPGHPAIELPLEDRWRDYHLLLPSNASGDTAITLRTPAYVPGGADTRSLGVALQQLAATTPLLATSLPPWPRLLFLISLPLTLFLLIWRISGALTPAAAAAGAGLLLVGWAAAQPILAGYLLPTIGWPWLSLFVPLLLLAWPALPGLGRAVVHPLRRFAPLPLWLGLLLLCGGLLALRLFPTWLPALLAAAGALLALSDPRFTPGAMPVAAPLPRQREVAALLAIAALALGLRLFELGQLPPGLWRDEARHGLLALRIWQDPSFRPIYVVEGADLPALYFYLAAPLVGISGPTVASIRLVSALAGALTPLALWWAARPLLGPRAALLGAALLAWSSWSLSMSRWAFPATLDQVLLLLAVGLIWRALDRVNTGSRGALLFAALAGFSAGLAAYAYHTGRSAPFILALIVLARLGFSLAAWRRALPLLLIAALSGLLTLAPLLAYIAGDLEGYNRRVGSVLVFKSIETDMHSPLSLLLRNGARYLAMWHLAGDPNGRHHAPGSPLLDPLSGGMLILGLAFALRASPQQPALRVLPVWLLAALLPGLFSTDAPHAMRSLGTLAPACMLAGLGLERLLAPTSGRRFAPWIAPPLASAMLLFSLSFNGWLYFGQMRHDPLVYREFDMEETAMGQIAATSNAATAVYVPRSAARSDTLRFLATDKPPLTLEDAATLADGRPALLLLPADAPAAQVAAAQALLGPRGREVGGGPRYPDGQPVLRVFSNANPQGIDP